MELGALDLQRKAAAAIAKAECLSAAEEQKSGAPRKASRTLLHALVTTSKRRLNCLAKQWVKHVREKLHPHHLTLSRASSHGNPQWRINSQSLSDSQVMKPLKMEASLTGASAPAPAAHKSLRNHPGGNLDPRTSGQPMEPTAPSFIPRQNVASAVFFFFSPLCPVWP